MARRGWTVLLLLVLQVRLGWLQTCGNSDVKSKGAKGDGSSDDTPAFDALDKDDSAGVIFMSPGVYRITRTIQLNKPIVAQTGAVFKVDGGVTLTLYNQPQHPYSSFFTGDGTVKFGPGTQYVLPEWFGAAADGSADDSSAVQKAYDASRPNGNAMVYLKGTYGIGKELLFAPGAVVMAEDSAKFVSVNGNSKGITFTGGNSGVKSVLPHLEGFSDFAARLQGLNLGALQFKTIRNCGDGIRIESTGKGVSCLDNTVWFNKIIDCRVGVSLRAETTTCEGANCVFQGNQVTGDEISGGPTTGDAYAILFSALSYPAWDSNNIDILSIVPPSNPSYRVVHAKPAADREIIKIGSLDALPDPNSRVFGSGKMNQMQISIRHKAPLQEFQFGLWGELNLVELSGELTPKLASTPVRCTNAANTKAQFNGGKALYGTYNTLQAVPTTDWPSGTVRTFYFYHQLANDYLYQLKCNALKNKDGLPSIDCVQYNDNFKTVPNEVVVWLINQSGGTVKAGDPATFTIAINTLGNPA